MVNKDKEVPEWYLNSSLLQCAFYKSLLLLSNGMLVTSTFYVNLGNPKLDVNVNILMEYHLLFGEDEYIINVSKPKEIVDFFVNKAYALSTWDDARSFDQMFKRKEFEHLKNCFTYNKFN